MSAGDVKFIGWQGTNPSFQELEPSISYEPFRQFQQTTAGFGNLEIGQYVRAKVTRTLIVFSKDKDTFIGGLDYSNNTLNLTYVDSDGSIKTKSYGSGWEILSFDESPAAKGYTQIRLTYEKVIAKSLAFFGVDGLTVDCVDGVCRIRYKNNDIETIDSGTGICTTGLRFVIERLDDEILSVDDFDRTLYRVQVVCNDLISDVTEIIGRDLPTREILAFAGRQELETTTFEKEYPNYTLAVEGYENFLARELWTSEEIAQAIDGIKSSYLDTENVKTTVEIQQTPSALYVPVREPLLAEESFDDPFFVKSTGSRLTAKILRRAIISRTTTFPSKILPLTLFVRWQKEGNVVKLVFGGNAYSIRGDRAIIQPVVKTIREYDVTGLS